ncbi:MAG: sterol desaturase family protein [Nostoc sp. EkiNYC01]
MLVLIGFWVLMGLTLLQPEQRQALRRKSREDWLLDSIGLLVQGGIPWLQTLLVFGGCQFWFPQLQGCLDWQPWFGCAIAFVGVDYLYYWNHRLLHTAPFFPLHAVHHTVSQMDVLGTSRNTLWSSLLIVYIWVNGVMMYLLKDPSGYALGISLTYILDLWRHSELHLTRKSLLYQLLNSWLILPHDHAHHHGDGSFGNFGANLKLWDRLHHTFGELEPESQCLGIPLVLSLRQKLLCPFFQQIQ